MNLSARCLLCSAGFIFFAAMSSASYAFPHADSAKSERPDTSRSSAGHLVPPVADAGSIMGEPSYTISDSEITWNDYTYSGQVLQQIPGSFLADMSQPGDPSELYFDGLGSDHVKYTMDGVDLNEPTTSTLNLYQFPMELAHHVEFLDGLRAPIYEYNATGALVNFQTYLYSDSVPFSQVRHVEGPYNYLITDGIFSQNIGFKSNIDLGFEHQTSDGRFVNSVYSGWNIRGTYRYSFDSTDQITATDLYYRTKGGMTGGDLPYNVNITIFDQGLSPVRNQYANLTYWQHHAQVSYSHADPVDSASFFTATAFYDYYNFEYGDVSTPYFFTNVSERYGGNLRGSEMVAFTRLNFGAAAARDVTTYNSGCVIPSRTRFSIYGDDEFDLLNFIRAGVFGRGDLISGKFHPALGASFGLGTDNFSIDAGAVMSSHVPDLSEMYFKTTDFTGNPDLMAESDKLLEVTATAKFGESFDVLVKPYARFIDNPIYFRTKYSGQPVYPSISVVNLNTRDIYGLDATVNLSIWKFGAQGNLNYVYERVDGNGVITLPKYFISGQLYFHDILFTGHLNVKVGVRGKYMSSFMGSEFYPVALVYYPAELNVLGPYGSTDFFLQAKIGDAVVFLTIYNLTGENYVLTPIYPALNNSFAFGINWPFLN